MRNTIKLLFALFVTQFAISSCVEDIKFGDAFLEKAPGVDVTKDTIFNDSVYSRDFLWSCYSRMYYAFPTAWNAIDGKMNMGMFEALSDCWHSHMNWDGLCRYYYSGAYNASYENWNTHCRFTYNREGCWEAVRACWLFIENVDKAKDMNDAEKKRLKAEAKCIIASRYFDLYRHLGGLPIVDHAYAVNEDITNPRATLLETNDFMIKLLDEAIPDLPWVLSEEDYRQWDGRFTQAAAMGLKCKILLYTASPLFNDKEPYCNEEPLEAVQNKSVWTGEYMPELWEKCLRACEDFFNTVNTKGFYHLVEATSNTTKSVLDPTNGYRVAFRDAYSLRGSGYDNPELLISVRKTYNNYGYFKSGSIPGGSFTPTEEYVEMFPMSDGTDFSWDDKEKVKNIFSARDPRLYETVLVNGAYYKGNPAQMYVNGREMKNCVSTESGQYATGYGIYKYVRDGQVENGRPIFWPYLRMAEVYLIYAEALMKTGQYDKAVEQIDKIRARVGLPGLKASFPDVDFHSEATLMPEILRERACELGMEDVRLFDLCRNKMADHFTTPLHGLKITKNGSEYTYEVFELRNPSRYLWNKEFDTKWYLSAFPPNEINKGYGLTQNPGWK